MKNADMPAAPVRGRDGEPMNLLGENSIMYSGDAMGLSKREMMALHFCAGLMAGPRLPYRSPKGYAEDAIAQADALLAELEGGA